jgi:hypothetical protein
VARSDARGADVISVCSLAAFAGSRTRRRAVRDFVGALPEPAHAQRLRQMAPVRGVALPADARRTIHGWGAEQERAAVRRCVGGRVAAGAADARACSRRRGADGLRNCRAR